MLEPSASNSAAEWHGVSPAAGGEPSQEGLRCGADVRGRYGGPGAPAEHLAELATVASLEADHLTGAGKMVRRGWNKFAKFAVRKFAGRKNSVTRATA